MAATSHTYPTAGRASVKLRMTAAGHRALKRARSIKLATDLAVLEDAGRTVRLLLTPGDPRLLTTPRPLNLAAGTDVLSWSQPDPAGGGYRLAVRRAGRVSILPTPRYHAGWAASCGPPTVTEVCGALRPRIARVRVGRPAISFVACRGRRCAPYAWDLDAQRLHRLAIAVPRGCILLDIAVWSPRLAYELDDSDGGHCRKRRSGVTVRSGSRTVMRIAGELGDFRAGWLAWFAPWPRYGGAKLRLALVGHPSRVVSARGADCQCAFDPPRLAGGYLVWGEEDLDKGTTLWRTRLKARQTCRRSAYDPGALGVVPGTDWGYHQNIFTMRGASVLYAFGDAIFRVDPARLHWSRCFAE